MTTTNTDTPASSKEEISKEYADLCTAAGDLGYRIKCMKSDLKLINNRLHELTEQAAQMATEGEKSA